MNKDEILDAEFSDIEPQFYHSIRWWEKSRILYNILLLGIELIVMLKYAEQTMQYGLTTAIIHTLIVNIIANIIYTMGLGLDVVLAYYFKKPTFNRYLKVFLFIIGTTFSMVLAFSMYTMALRF